MTMTRDEIENLLDGTTPGPWQADGEPWNRIVWSSVENRVCFMAHSNGLDDARDVATSNLAAAAPDLASTALALMAQLEDAKAAQAMVVERAAEVCASRAAADEEYAARYPVEARKYEDRAHRARTLEAAIRTLADTSGVEALAALRAERDALRAAVEGLIAVLDRNDKKGPIPNVEMMFCWLAAQDVRAAFRKIAPKGEAT